MFGFSKEVQIKRKLILFLDSQERYVTSKELKHHLNNMVTEQTILKYLRDVRKIITKDYSTNKLSLQIDTRNGIRLNRNETNLNDLLEKIYREDLVYEIFRLLILNRSFTTENFCIDHEVSFSTLRRIVRRINDAVEPYQISIKAGLQISISGKESQIRMIYFMFLFYIHRGIMSVDWVEPEHYIKLAKLVYEAFYIDEEQPDLFALWLFINHYSNNNGNYLEENLFEESFSIDLPENHFSTNSWKYVLLIMYGLDFANFVPETSFEIIHENRFSVAIKQWLVLFEKNIGSLLPKEKESLYRRMHKYVLLEKILPTLKDVQQIFGIQNSLLIEETQIHFWRVFEKMWQQFSSSLPKFETEEIREILMTWSFQYTPLQELLPTITIYWKSNLPTMNVCQIGKILQYRLKKEANVFFTNEAEKADLILSTETSNDSAITVSPLLTKKDIQTVKDFVRGFKKN